MSRPEAKLRPWAREQIRRLYRNSHIDKASNLQNDQYLTQKYRYQRWENKANMYPYHIQKCCTTIKFQVHKLLNSK